MLRKGHSEVSNLIQNIACYGNRNKYQLTDTIKWQGLLTGLSAKRGVENKQAKKVKILRDFQTQTKTFRHNNKSKRK